MVIYLVTQMMVVGEISVKAGRNKSVRGHFKRRETSGDVSSKDRNGKTSKFSGKNLRT